MPIEKPKEQQKPLEASKEVKDPRIQGVHEGAGGDDLDLGTSGQTCGEGMCQIPTNEEEIAAARARAEKERAATETASEGKWEKVSINDIDKKAKKNDIVLVGATWCSACKEAKKMLPLASPDSNLIYIDYDEDPDKIEAKFQLKGTLPGTFTCENPGSYKKFG